MGAAAMAAVVPEGAAMVAAVWGAVAMGVGQLRVVVTGRVEDACACTPRLRKQSQTPLLYLCSNVVFECCDLCWCFVAVLLLCVAVQCCCAVLLLCVAVCCCVLLSVAVCHCGVLVVLLFALFAFVACSPLARGPGHVARGIAWKLGRKVSRGYRKKFLIFCQLPVFRGMFGFDW